MNYMEHIKNEHARILGALGGRACTEKQNAARRLNGRKGGRPKKVKINENSSCKPERSGII